MTSPIRSPSHLAFVRRQRCWFCQAERDVVAHHHSKKYGGGGTGMRGCDLLTVPLCRAHHDEWHSRAQIGDLTTTETQREMWKGMAITLRAWIAWKRVAEAAEAESELEP